MERVRKHLIGRKRQLALICTLVAATAALWGTEASAQVVTIEENTLGFCAVEGTVDSNHSGFTGSGFANGNNATGSRTTVAITGMAKRPCSSVVNRPRRLRSGWRSGCCTS